MGELDKFTDDDLKKELRRRHDETVTKETKRRAEYAAALTSAIRQCGKLLLTLFPTGCGHKGPIRGYDCLRCKIICIIEHDYEQWDPDKGLRLVWEDLPNIEKAEARKNING